MKKIIINSMLIIFVLIFVICIIITKYGENDRQQLNKSTNEMEIQEKDNNIVQQTQNVIIQNEINEYPKEEIESEYRGYEVCAKLQIPTISLETNILSEYSTKSLKTSVTKFWGVKPNHNGNFCIAGHNFKNKNMFSNLKKLQEGDKLYVIDREIGKVEYEIFKIYQVYPNDTSCLDAITKNQKEVTLITCTTDSKKRIIVKAKEANK